jgi:putative redox protein
MSMSHRFPSGELTLAAHLARPAVGATSGLPGLVLTHGFPSGRGGAPKSAHTYPQLADRIATELGWVVLAFNLRGCRPSQGQFSIRGWLDDIRAAVDHLEGDATVQGTWCAGFGTGGALGICAGAEDERILGVAAMGAPADFDDWAGHPRRLLDHAREVGVIDEPEWPASLDAWARPLKQLRPIDAAGDVAPRPLLVMHGSADSVVPDFDARLLSDAHGSAEMRFIAGAGHQLRHDPRAVAVLLGWLDRQKHAA